MTAVTKSVENERPVFPFWAEGVDSKDRGCCQGRQRDYLCKGKQVDKIFDGIRKKLIQSLTDNVNQLTTNYNTIGKQAKFHWNSIQLKTKWNWIGNHLKIVWM